MRKNKASEKKINGYPTKFKFLSIIIVLSLLPILGFWPKVGIDEEEEKPNIVFFEEVSHLGTIFIITLENSQIDQDEYYSSVIPYKNAKIVLRTMSYDGKLLTKQILDQGYRDPEGHGVYITLYRPRIYNLGGSIHMTWMKYDSVTKNTTIIHGELRNGQIETEIVISENGVSPGTLLYPALEKNSTGILHLVCYGGYFIKKSENWVLVNKSIFGSDIEIDENDKVYVIQRYDMLFQLNVLFIINGNEIKTISNVTGERLIYYNHQIIIIDGWWYVGGSRTDGIFNLTIQKLRIDNQTVKINKELITLNYSQPANGGAWMNVFITVDEQVGPIISFSTGYISDSYVLFFKDEKAQIRKIKEKAYLQIIEGTSENGEQIAMIYCPCPSKMNVPVEKPAVGILSLQ